MRFNKFPIFISVSIAIIVVNAFIIFNKIEVVYSKSDLRTLNDEIEQSEVGVGDNSDKVVILELSNSGSLIEIDELFDDSGELLAVSEAVEEKRFSLGDLFVLDRLFDEGEILDKDVTSLGDLFILDRLFSDSSFSINKNVNGGLSLGELFVLDELFNGNEILDSDITTLSDLFILDKLFNH